MRIALVLFLLAGCAASPSSTNAGTDKAPPQAPAPSPPQAPPPAPAPPDPGPTAESFRPAIEANEAPFRVPGTVTAQLNEEVQVGDLRVRPLEVVEDSRCPPDVACVWAGRIRVRVAVSGAGEPVMEIGHPVTVAGGRRLTLVGAAPINWAHPPAGVDPNEPKRFAFRLTGMD
jgi:hypothetical protein